MQQLYTSEKPKVIIWKIDYCGFLQFEILRAKVLKGLKFETCNSISLVFLCYLFGTWGRASIKHWTPVLQLYSSAEFRDADPL